MSDVKTDEKIVDDLLERGIENIIPSRDLLRQRLLSGERLKIYFGIDPTAERIHLGHAFNLRKLQTMVELGHEVTFLIGSFTALVGDTSDKNDERPLLSEDDIKANFASYQKQAEAFLDFERVNLAFNHEWLSDLSLKTTLEIAGNFSLNDFVSRELIKKRLDDGKRVGLVETFYPLLQGYDSYHLKTDIQFGATDQTFNMQAGRSLIKKLDDRESFVVASGYLSGTDGRKMSKSWGNAIWLDDPAEEVFGKVMRISDESIEEYFWLGTNLPAEEIKGHISSLADGHEHPMEVKKVLARTITGELCGSDSVEAAESNFVSTTQQKEAGESTLRLNYHDGLNTALDLLPLLQENSLVESNSEARRLFEQGAIRVNDRVVKLEDELNLNDGENQIRVGKRRYLIIDK